MAAGKNMPVPSPGAVSSRTEFEHREMKRKREKSEVLTAMGSNVYESRNKFSTLNKYQLKRNTRQWKRLVCIIHVSIDKRRQSFKRRQKEKKTFPCTFRPLAFPVPVPLRMLMRGYVPHSDGDAAGEC